MSVGPEFPAYILKDLRAIVPKFVVSWHRWEDAEGVCPLIGLPFERIAQEDGSVQCCCYTHPAGPQKWTITKEEATRGRFIIFEENNGRQDKLFDIVYHDCSPIDPVTNGRMIYEEVAQRIGVWKEAEAEVLSREKKAAERAAMAQPFEEKVQDAAADSFRRGEGYSQVQVPGYKTTPSGIIVPN